MGIEKKSFEIKPRVYHAVSLLDLDRREKKKKCNDNNNKHQSKTRTAGNYEKYLFTSSHIF